MRNEYSILDIVVVSSFLMVIINFRVIFVFFVLIRSAVFLVLYRYKGFSNIRLLHLSSAQMHLCKIESSRFELDVFVCKFRLRHSAIS